MRIKNKKIEGILIESIQGGKSSYDVANRLGIAPTTARRWADRIGLRFRGKSGWNKYHAG